VDIDPVQLIVVHHLLRFGASPMETLYREVEGVRTLPREMFDAAMASLVADDVADYRFRPEDGVTLLALTELGMRLRGSCRRRRGAGWRSTCEVWGELRLTRGFP